MNLVKIKSKKRVFFIMCGFIAFMLVIIMRLFYIQCINAWFYQEKAYEQQTRDRLISPKRGDILDRNGEKIATVNTVSSISVVHSQVEDYEKTARLLAEKLDLEYAWVLSKVEERVALVRIKTKVDKALAQEIANLNLKGVMIDEDIKRVYPFSDLASQVIGFVGKDNQGIVGLEAKYETYLKGEKGKIMTETDGRGREFKNSQQVRVAPVDGKNLVTSIDVNIQQFAQQIIEKAVAAKNAKRGSIIVMNPQNGEIYAMANYPSFDLNSPFEINDEGLKSKWDTLSQKEKNNALNQMWRNFTINDTYEPGSTFKVITSAAGLEEKVVTENDSFSCNGGRTVANRYIKCWRSPRTHGNETFVQGVQNSCNPVFMDVVARLGADKFYEYMLKYGFAQKTGIDLPGEAVGIMHKKENVGPVELATMSFGQSFQITPLQLVRAVSITVNGGYAITPHFGIGFADDKGNTVADFKYEKGEQVVSSETSEGMKKILESVVSVGTGNKTYIPGYRIGGKTATSEKLPRKSGKYIASFCAFAPAENPQVVALVLIDEPQGVYYGGQVAGPVMKELLSNVLPYLGIEPEYTQEELEMDGVSTILVEDYTGKKVSEVKNALQKLNLEVEVKGEGDAVTNQFPMAGEEINQNTKFIIYAN